MIKDRKRGQQERENKGFERKREDLTRTNHSCTCGSTVPRGSFLNHWHVGLSVGLSVLAGSMINILTTTIINFISELITQDNLNEYDQKLIIAINKTPDLINTQNSWW